ncbi:MAG: energy transducer TonB [Candidatus Solibacter usitatus]|nr:energy transducer TonB [Candidatus Solibacter usitatus]
MIRLTFVLLLVAGLSAQGPYKIGDGVSAPVPVYKTEPAYTQEAKDARIEGSIVLGIVVTVEGKVSEVRVLKTRLIQRDSGKEAPSDLGLQEQAIKAVVAWKFKPGTKDGKPVAVAANVEMNFRLK